MGNVIDVRNLHTYFFTDDGILKAVDGVSFSIEAGQTFGLIGESGCGKSVTSQSILQIVPIPGRIVNGQILYQGSEDQQVKDSHQIDLAILKPNSSKIRSIRGHGISMIFQEPMTSLSPVHTVGNQLMEAITIHRTRNKAEAREIACEMLKKVGITNPVQRMDEYPHQLSGGLRQRVMIAMALSCRPSLLIADEPTTALDVTVQAQVLDLMKTLQKEFGMSIMYITHDLGVIAEVADVVAVMYLGKIVEMGTLQQVFRYPLHPYTERLMKSIPSIVKKRNNQKLETIEGSVPIPINLPERCGFYDRCPLMIKGTCDQSAPRLINRNGGHMVSCFLYGTETAERSNVGCHVNENVNTQKNARGRQHGS